MFSTENEPVSPPGCVVDTNSNPTDSWESVVASSATVPRRRRRAQLNKAVVSTATKLLPLVELLETIQPHVGNESIFHAKRVKINAQIALVYAQLRSERPKRKAMVQAFQTMGKIVREETKEISRDEVKDATKELVLATIKNAPGLISAAHQAGLLS